MKYVGMLLTLLAMAGFASAQPAVEAPEVDGSSLASGVALVSGTLLMIRGRKR